jgi:hypothetical protein
MFKSILAFKHILTEEFHGSHRSSQGVPGLAGVVPEVGFLDVDDGQHHRVRVQRIGLLAWTKATTGIDCAV